MGTGYTERARKNAAWVCPPFEDPDVVDLGCVTHLGYVFLDSSIFADALEERGLQRLALRLAENSDDVTLNHLADLLFRVSTVIQVQ